LSSSYLEAITVRVTLSVCGSCVSCDDTQAPKLTDMLVSGCFSDFTIIAQRSSNAEEPVRILVHKLVPSLRFAALRTMIEPACPKALAANSGLQTLTLLWCRSSCGSCTPTKGSSGTGSQLCGT
jgi:hypothetical protein